MSPPGDSFRAKAHHWQLPGGAGVPPASTPTGSDLDALKGTTPSSLEQVVDPSIADQQANEQVIEPSARIVEPSLDEAIDPPFNCPPYTTLDSNSIDRGELK